MKLKKERDGFLYSFLLAIFACVVLSFNIVSCTLQSALINSARSKYRASILKGNTRVKRDCHKGEIEN